MNAKKNAKNFATMNANKYFYGKNSHRFYGLGTNEIAGRIAGYSDGIIFFVGSPAIIAAFTEMNNSKPITGLLLSRSVITGSIDEGTDIIFGREMECFGKIMEEVNKNEIEQLIKKLEL